MWYVSIQTKELQNLHFHLLFFVFQEKDAALDRWQEADQEIDRLQRELQVQANTSLIMYKEIYLIWNSI